MEKTTLPKKAVRDRRDFDNTFHPGVEAADLLHEVHGITVHKPEGFPNHEDFAWPENLGKVLCHNCGWTAGDQIHAHYTSRFQLMYAGSNSGIWELGRGGPWLMKDYPDRPEVPFAKDYIVRKFIREKVPSVPVPESYSFKGSDNFSFEVMARVKGVPACSVLKNFSEQQTSDFYKDLGEHMKQWRQITSTRMERVDGSELVDGIIGNCNSKGCIKTGSNEDEWLENLTPAMRKGLLSQKYLSEYGWTKDKEVLESWVKEADEKIVKLKANFPRGGPYVLTHGDLHSGNVFVSDDNEEKKWKVSGIIDWEHAIFYPWWAEALVSLLKDEYVFTKIQTEQIDAVLESVEEVMGWWKRGGSHSVSKHGLDRANTWYRRPLCDCQRYAPFIGDHMLGWEDQHADVFDIDSEGEDIKIGFEKLPKPGRDFQRWFNEISRRS